MRKHKMFVNIIDGVCSTRPARGYSTLVCTVSTQVVLHHSKVLRLGIYLIYREFVTVSQVHHSFKISKWTLFVFGVINARNVLDILL